MGASSKDGRKAGLGVVETLRHALRFWRPHLGIGLLLVATLAVPQGYKAFFAWSQRILIDRAILGGDLAAGLRVLVALAVGFVLAAVAVLFVDWLGAKAAAAILNGIRLRMFEKLERLSLGYYGRVRSGDVVARFTSDLSDIQKSLTTRVVDAILATLGLLINVPVAFAIDARLGLVMLAGLPVTALGTRLFGRRAAAARYDLKQQEAAIAATVAETIRAQPVVKVFGLGEWILGRFRRELDEVGSRARRAEFLAELVGSASSIGVLAVQLAVLGVGVWLAATGRLSAGSLVAFLSLHAVVSKDAYDLTKKVIPSLISSSGGLARIDELLEEPVEIADAPNALPLPAGSGAIRFEGVDFSYGGGRPVLSGLSFEIAPGERVAIVGPSGSGKSTVLQLLLRFYDPSGGRVTYLGKDLRSVTVASLHARMAAVFQESFLFAGTIRENILLGKLDATEEEVRRAARDAEIDEAIAALPDGYDTAVGELGGRLSGGQRQRIAIARAILRDPAILLLDEATSALDPATEAAVNATIERLARGRIVLFVTHRLGGAKGADRILVLDGGHLVESGSHAELLAAEGLYRSLYDKQSGIEVSDDGLEARIDPDRLARVPLFHPLDAAAREAIARRLTPASAATDEVILREGERGERLYLIARGKVAVEAGTGEGARRLAVLGDGDLFGEMALLADAPRIASVRALEPTTLLVLSRKDLDALFADHPAIRDAMAAMARERSLELAGLVADSEVPFR